MDDTNDYEFSDEELEELLPMQKKPEKSLNYHEKVAAGQIRGGLRPISKKRQPEQAKYSRESVKWLEGKRCEICRTENNLSVHHMGGRGSLLNVKSLWLPLCVGDSLKFLKNKYPDLNYSGVTSCHSLVEANLKWAREMGYSTYHKIKGEEE